MASNKEIINFLTTRVTNASFVDKIKIKYRPIICPFDELLSYVGDSVSVFDIGCGSGQFCSLVAKFTEATKIKGVEISQRLVNNANEINSDLKKLKQIEFSVFNGKYLPEDLSNYDVIFLIDVIHHVPQEQQIDFINEIYNKMKNGAKLVFKDIDAAHPFVFFNKIHDLIFAGKIGKEMSSKEVEKGLNETGFKIIEKKNKTIFVYPHYFFICLK